LETPQLSSLLLESAPVFGGGSVKRVSELLLDV